MKELQQSYLTKIQKCSAVKFARAISFSEASNLLKEKLSEEEYLLRKQRAKKVFIFLIKYISNKKEISGYVVIPKGKPEDTFPSIIYNRGGSYELGALTYGAAWGVLGEVASWGYIVFASQYSGNGGSEGEEDWGGESINDSLVFKKIISSLDFANNHKIGMMGGSRGGMVTYRALSQVKWIKAAVSSGGVSNLERNAKLRPGMAKVFKKSFGGKLSEMRKRSALFFADSFSKKTPVLLLHGLADWRVVPEDSIELSQKLREHGVPHRLVLYEGTDHQFTESKEHMMREIKEWFERFVKNEEKTPNTKPHGA